MIEILRATLEKLEQSDKSGPNDAALRELKASILRPLLNWKSTSRLLSPIYSCEKSFFFDSDVPLPK